MDHIKSLREALKLSPQNIPLKQLLADLLLELNRLDEAETEYLSILRNNPTQDAKTGLASVYFKKGKFSASIVILEELIQSGISNSQAHLLYAKSLFEENQISQSIIAYKKALELDPSSYDEDLDKNLRITNQSNESEVTDTMDDRFIKKSKINFDHVAGMNNVKKEIDLKIIKPLLHPEIYKAYGKPIGGGILLFGPPGCGKTFIAKATAGQINAKFINIALNDILDMWIGASEKNLNEIFELARNNTPCVLFIDEIDALGASRSDMKQSSGKQLINQFLMELDGINNSNEGILVIGATNTPWNMDTAFKRPGRFDRMIFVSPPDVESREALLRLKLADKPKQDIDYRKLAKKTKNYSGADINAIVDMAIEQKLESAFNSGIPKPIETKDLFEAIAIHNPTTQEWFTTAKNYALFANDSGLYDDVLSYLKIKK